MFTTYLDFEIQLRLLDAGRYALAVSCPLGGDASGTLTLPTEDHAYQAIAARLAHLDADEEILVELGQMLFRALFQGQIKDVYTRSQGALGLDQGLRLRFNIDATDVAAAALPWEFLSDPDQGPLAMLDMPVVRYLPQQSKFPTLAATLPLKVLVTGAQTPPVPDIAHELNGIQAALDELAAGGRVQITVEPHLTTSKLQRLMREGFHIWHFIGHGEIGKDGRTGMLCFEDANGQVDQVSPLQLSILLNRSGLRLVVLNACNSGTLMVDPFRSMAPALIRAQVSAVIAMQFTAPEKAMRAFASEFYRALGEGFPIDASVTEGRRAIMGVSGLNAPDWGIPVVYTRAPDGKLFNLTPSVERPLAPDIRAVRPGSPVPPDWLRIPDIHTAVASCWQDYQAARKRMSLVSGYKELHDRFQQLDSGHSVIVRAAKRLPTDHPASEYHADWEYLGQDVRAFQEVVEKVLDAANRQAIAEGDALWIKKLDRARLVLDTAVQRRDLDQLVRANRLIGEVLDREISRINTRLVVAASELRLLSLVETLKRLRDRMVGLGANKLEARQVETFSRTVDNLAQLAERLDILIGNQDDFQEVEDELRLVEASLDQDMSELEATWRSLKPKIQRLCYDVQASWATRLTELGDQLERLIATADSDMTSLRATFLDYRSQVNRSFNKIDWDLRTLCGALVDTSDDLAPLLGMAA